MSLLLLLGRPRIPLPQPWRFTQKNATNSSKDFHVAETQMSSELKLIGFQIHKELGFFSLACDQAVLSSGKVKPAGLRVKKVQQQ